VPRRRLGADAAVDVAQRKADPSAAKMRRVRDDIRARSTPPATELKIHPSAPWFQSPQVF
jgi:hypothetical protein